MSTRRRFWTVKQLCQRWADQDGPLPRTTVYSWIQSGKLKATKLGGKTLVSAEQLEAFEDPAGSLERLKKRVAVQTGNGSALADKYGY
jgi:excisionase family DNA binding protein